MGQVFVTTYEIVGAGLGRAAEYYAAIEAAQGEHWKFVESVAGAGYRPAHDGGLRTVFFKGDLPAGWRKVGRQGDRTEAAPSRTSKAGKEIAKQIASLPDAPQPHVLAAALGYCPNEMALDGARGVIYFPTTTRVHFPAERVFIRLPRFATDGFAPDEAVLRAMAESEFMKALEDHNFEARRQREAANG